MIASQGYECAYTKSWANLNAADDFQNIEERELSAGQAFPSRPCTIDRAVNSLLEANGAKCPPP
jgi:hypothetical protein